MTTTTPQPERTDAAPIDWDNVVVETNVMIRLQDVKPGTKKDPG